MRALLLAAVAVIGWVGAADATPGLTLSIYGNIPFYDYYPTDSTIDSEMAYAASTAPDSQLVYAADPSDYGIGVGGSTIADFTGSLIVTTAGLYSFNVAADDAARILVDGQTIVESNFYGDGLNYASTASLFLTAGTHAYEGFYFQTVGGAYYDATISDGPESVAFDSATPATAVPEPTSLALLGMGVIGITAGRRRRVG